MKLSNFCNVQVFLRKGSREEQKLNVTIGSLISKPLNEFDSMGAVPEVNAFRREALITCSVCVSAHFLKFSRKLFLLVKPADLSLAHYTNTHHQSTEIPSQQSSANVPARFMSRSFCPQRKPRPSQKPTRHVLSRSILTARSLMSFAPS